MGCPGHLCPWAFLSHLPKRPSLTVFNLHWCPLPSDRGHATLWITQAFPAVSPPWGPAPYHVTGLRPLRLIGRAKGGWLRDLAFTFVHYPEGKSSFKVVSPLSRSGEKDTSFLWEQKNRISIALTSPISKRLSLPLVTLKQSRTSSFHCK